MKQIEMRDIAKQAASYATAKFPSVLIETFVQGARWAAQEFVLDLQSRLRELEDENAELKATKGVPADNPTLIGGKSARALVVQRERRGPPPAEFVRAINSNPLFAAPYAAQAISATSALRMLRCNQSCVPRLSTPAVMLQ